ncbi:bifunctional riboflavin kinase/FAD synthetase [Enterovirga aerilata]|uniref:Riboflavin biosynthesis protein n=1 Tax=Enterovirga aerilata TaxID=2730920 RepID=A0A849HY80_9HYPH|nr:bifunctional riboflavin kinase/FAD synthetase [Enterovirga sp. DB1703]NNM72486.1 bifunctional riboflavin kinase/FAD synthetase [Enterovirga sp. DB1703]
MITTSTQPARDLTVCRDGDAVPPHLQGAVIAIGNFDGLHRGHQALVTTAIEGAHREGRPAAILTFDPHPRAFFAPGAAHFRLTPEAVKLKILRALGLDVAFIRRFDASLAATAARDFVSALLRGELAASALVVGGDFHFGRGREGTPAVLAELARENGIGLTMVGTVEADGAPVSSSRIRAALEAGDIAHANALLGYRWFVRREIGHGDKRGRTLGYPTANMSLDPGCRLAHGIYAVRAATAPGEVREGVASFGRRPTFDNGAPLLETYIFDFAEDLYGREIEIELVGRIRSEERFADAEALVAQMKRDEAAARELLARGSSSDLRSFIG